MSAVELYWITRLDAIRSALVWLALIPIAVAASYHVYLFCLWMDEDSGYYRRERDDDEKKKLQGRKALKLWGTALVILVIVCVALALLPSTKDMLIIQGLDRIVNSKEVQNLSALLYERLQELLSGALK